MPKQRLQKLIAQTGRCSRRKAEELILAGRVRVDRRVVRELGTTADPEKQRIDVDGDKLQFEKKLYLLVNKPDGMITSHSDEAGRPVVFNLIQEKRRLVSVGRLDYHTEGALILTNDGELVHRLTHPSHRVPREYEVKVQGKLNSRQVAMIANGVELEDGPTQPVIIEKIRDTDKNSWYLFILTEGRNREVRRIVEAVGSTVLKLRRAAFANLRVDDMNPGDVRPLSPKEVLDLYEMTGLIDSATISDGFNTRSRPSSPLAAIDPLEKSRPAGLSAPTRKAPTRKGWAKAKPQKPKLGKSSPSKAKPSMKPAWMKSADERPTRNKRSDFKTADERPSRGKRPATRELSELKRGDNRPARGERSEFKRGDNRPARGERSEFKRGDSRPARGERSEFKRGDSRPARGERSEFKRGDSRPARGERSEFKRGDSRPARGERSEFKRGDSRPARGERSEFKRGDSRPARGERSEFKRGDSRPARGERSEFKRGDSRPARGERSEFKRGDSRPARGERSEFKRGDSRPARGSERGEFRRDESAEDRFGGKPKRKRPGSASRPLKKRSTKSKKPRR